MSLKLFIKERNPTAYRVEEVEDDRWWLSSTSPTPGTCLRRRRRRPSSRLRKKKVESDEPKLMTSRGDR